jgi:hypothetical protein
MSELRARLADRVCESEPADPCARLAHTQALLAALKTKWEAAIHRPAAQTSMQAGEVELF